MASALLLITATLLLLWLVSYVRRSYSYFSNKNMLSPKPTFPLGNFWKVGLTVHFIEKINSMYREFKGKDVLCGFYIFTKPVYLILDIDLIKNIMVKDFYSFHDRGLYHNEKTDPLSAHLFSVTFRNLSKFEITENFYIFSSLSQSILFFLRGGRWTLENSPRKNDDDIFERKD